MARMFTDEGKPYLDFYLASDSVFVNAKNIFIEYHDVLFAHGFSLLTCIAQTNWEIYPELFDYSMFEGMEVEDLYEWYINRKHQNFFYDIPIRGTFDTEEHRIETIENVYWGLMNIPETYYYSCKYELIKVIDLLTKTNSSLVSKFVIYGGRDKSDTLEASVRDLWGKAKDKLSFVYGPLEEALKTVDKDTTYFLSDISKIDTLIKLDRLNCATVMIANGWRYNYKDEDNSAIKYDAEELMKKYTSHVLFFDNNMIP